MTNGLIFDIKEFAINDGPGIRVTIFMKGCPLSCLWCHNPEGISCDPQFNNKTNCIVGEKYSVGKLVEKIKKYKDVFDLSNGGVTFSGGEPTLQSDFIYEVAKELPEIHKNLDTSGYCSSDVFKKLLSVFNLVYFDLKIIDEKRHKKFTGVSNKQILDNLNILEKSGVPFYLRIPLIPDITDTKENLNDIKNIILNMKNKPLRVDPLPYNILAGGKYDAYNMVFKLKNITNINNAKNILEFKKELLKNNINMIGEEVKCLQNV